jgi:hypothetical protein
MISLEDCIGMCGLSEEEILAIAEHEHVPEIIAAGLASYLSDADKGLDAVRDMIIDDIRAAERRADKAHVLELLHVLHHFLHSHPAARPAVHPWSSAF